jgi:hypothetical protein
MLIYSEVLRTSKHVPNRDALKEIAADMKM